jgi:3-methyladenine DNA glycosylase AlkD
MQASHLSRLRENLRALENLTDADIQRNYHKTTLRFYGIKTDRRREIVRQVYGVRFHRADVEADLLELWQSEYWDERMIALALLNKVSHELSPRDIPWLHQLTRGCDGWALLDTLATDALGSLALAFGSLAYEPLRAWSSDEWLWTRRASILLHIGPARKRELDAAYAWSTWEELLPETDFFIRKAIGWALREASKHYPQAVYEFLLRVGPRASSLTRREGARNLPVALRLQMIGK